MKINLICQKVQMINFNFEDELELKICSEQNSYVSFLKF